jgi:hypothetical protein
MIDEVIARSTDGAQPGSNGDAAHTRISPTDVSQFIRLEQCERYLWLRLQERARGRRFLEEYGVAPQAIPPLLTRSGVRFEEIVERDVAARFATMHMAQDVPQGRRREPNNALAVDHARTLPNGSVLFLFQPRLEVAIGEWLLRGDVDILRLERDHDGSLHVLIADMKSSTSARIEHRLQVAFYHEMLAALLQQEDVPYADMRFGILYRGPDGVDRALDPQEQAEHEAQRAAALALFGTTAGLFELVDDQAPYLGAVADLVTGSGSTADRVAASPLETLPAHLTYKCDGCLYNEFCMKWSTQRDDLSLLPHLTAQDKGALLRAGVDTVQAVAALKERARAAPDGRQPVELYPGPGNEDLVRRLVTTWPVGPRLDELIYRAQRYRGWKGDPYAPLSYIPHRGYGSLPYSAPDHNPNLVRVYIDAQHDYLCDRIYMLGALVVAGERGEEPPHRRRNIVHLTDGPPEHAEREEALFLAWITDLLTAIAELAAPDDDGQPRAPIHLIFFNEFEQRLLLEGLGRHLTRIMGATPLYDFLTQLAAFDSPIATFLDAEIRTLKNYPMVCQSLQAVAAYLRFDWNEPEPYRKIFRARLFDFWGKLDAGDVEDGASPWYTSRARFNSQIPLEYAYAAWDELAPAPSGGHDEFAPYRQATTDLLRGFHARRLEALEHVATDFAGNRQTLKTSFLLPDLARFHERARSLAEALDEFVLIERHVALAEWKRIRLASPEQRMLTGDALIGRYRGADQDPQVAATNVENLRRQRLREQYLREGGELTDEQRAETKWTQTGLRIRLEIEGGGAGCSLEEALALTTLRAGERVVVYARTAVDTRLPDAAQTSFTPTPKQLLYGTRATIATIAIQRDGDGQAQAAQVELVLEPGRGGPWSRGFAFTSIDRPFVDGELYTLDADPNDWSGYQQAMVTQALRQDRANTLYARLVAPDAAAVRWPEAAVAGQVRFQAGLDAFQQAGLLDPFEPSKRAFIGAHGEAPILLVQGPPGTGKSFTTAYAVLARQQGAMAADQDCRVFLSCKTHAAVDVLLANVAQAQERLRALRRQRCDLFDRYFDPRLLEVPLFRVAPKVAPPDGVIAIPRKEEKPKGTPNGVQRIAAQRWCVVAATPGGIYGLVKERWSNGLLGHELCDCLVLDEASQMNLPEAALAALLLHPEGQLIVVGDPRQMPPIVKHDWSAEARRTFREYRTYESLFDTLLARMRPLIQFEESFRLHADMAAFLRREIYERDGIPYFSRRHQTLRTPPANLDPFVAAVLAPEHPIVVVVHEEAGSQLRNHYEQALIAPVLTALADPATYNLTPEHGLGVVVPHRAQRAALQEALPCLTRLDPQTGTVALSAVDTVERFQGDERDVILVSATESDREYLLLAGEFLLDPRRLTVALSRAKHKMVLVASSSVFSLFSTDEETFAHVQLWKDLLRHTCVVKLWEGEREGQKVTVWGNRCDW